MEFDPLDYMEDALKAFRDEIDQLEEKGYEGPWMERKRGMHKKLLKAFHKLQESHQEEAWERHELALEVQKLKKETERIYLIAALWANWSDLQIMYRCWDIDYILDRMDEPPWNGEKLTTSNLMMAQLRKMEREDMPQEICEKFRRQITEQRRKEEKEESRKNGKKAPSNA